MLTVHAVGRLTRDPELRSLASGRLVTTFTIATDILAYDPAKNEDAVKVEYTAIAVWGPTPPSPEPGLPGLAGTYLSKNHMVAITGTLLTRGWEDDRKQMHWKTEVHAQRIEALSGANHVTFNEQALLLPPAPVVRG